MIGSGASGSEIASAYARLGSEVKLFEALRTLPLDWQRVAVTLADERWVDPSAPASNERLVRSVLLQDAAAAATFVGLKNAAATPELGATASWARLAGWPRSPRR